MWVVGNNFGQAGLPAPRADAAAPGSRQSGPSRRGGQPRLRDWEALWWKATREQERLRARVGMLLAEISRLSDRG